MSRGKIVAIALVALVAAWIGYSRWDSSADRERLSAALDEDLRDWAASEQPRPLLFGVATDEDPMVLYDEAFRILMARQAPPATRLVVYGTREDQFGLAGVLELLSRAARTSEGPKPGERWDGRPRICRPWFLSQIVGQVTGEAIWLQNQRVDTSRAGEPSVIPLMEHSLALLRFGDDFSRSVGGVCRSCISEMTWMGITLVGDLIRDGELTVPEAEMFERGLTAYLRGMPSAEEYTEVTRLAIQTEFRGALSGQWPVEDYPWGHVAEEIIGTERRILDAWETWRQREHHQEKDVDTLAGYVLSNHSPAAAAAQQRWLRRRLEQHLLGTRAYLFRRTEGHYPDRVEQLFRDEVVRPEPDGGQWGAGPTEGSGEWELFFVDPQGKRGWRMLLCNAAGSD